MSGGKRNPDIGVDDLQSEFDYESDADRKRKRTDFLEKERPGEEIKPGREQAKHWFQEEHGRMHRQMTRLMALDAYSRHKEMINLYHLSHPGATSLLQRDTSRDRTDYDVLKDNHKFLWSADDESRVGTSWEARMAKKYYDQLFKEYCIVDLTYYRKNKVAMRWRVEAEVKNGKGQFICGNKKCTQREDLTSWEVNFSYSENGERKNALVKVRLCPECSEMLNHDSQKKRSVKRRKEKKNRSGISSKNAEDNEKTDDSEDKKEAIPSSSGQDDVWQQPAQLETERTVDNDIDEFLDDLFD